MACPAEAGLCADAPSHAGLDRCGAGEASQIFLVRKDSHFDDAAIELQQDDAAAGPVCHAGDVWQLGPHRLVCGNALKTQVVATLMDGHKARMVFTDPPYNVPIDGHVCGSGAIRHREFAMASGEMSAGAFTDFLRTAFANMAAHSHDGAIHFICMDWRHMGEILTARGSVYEELKNVGYTRGECVAADIVPVAISTVQCKPAFFAVLLSPNPKRSSWNS